MLIEGVGVLEFQPQNITKKHNNQSSWKRIAMIRCYDDTAAYYSWFLDKRFNLKLNRPLRGSHITFINDKDIEVPNFNEISKIYNKKTIKFYIDPRPFSNGLHWWLRIYSPESEHIRILCGGSAKPFFGMHLTLGYANEKNIEHSQYIFNLCKRLFMHENRKPFMSINLK